MAWRTLGVKAKQAITFILLLVGDQLHSVGRQREGSGLHRLRVDSGLLRRRPVRRLPHGPGQEALQVDPDLPVRRLHCLLRLARASLR